MPAPKPLIPTAGLSPYAGLATTEWPGITARLIAAHPLSNADITDAVLQSWEQIMSTKIAGTLQMGRDYKPSPQVVGDFLHKLIPLALMEQYPQTWRQEEHKLDKDLVHIPNDIFSMEIKTSSSARGIFGNRSYAQPSAFGAKDKNGFYLAVNFQKFGAKTLPKISLIRFGWLDHTDWRGQEAETGQMAAPTLAARQGKFAQLFSLK